MNNIRTIQYEKARAVYQDLLRYRNESPDISKIRALAKNILYSSARVPLSGHYRLTAYEAVDLDSLNAELGLLKVDAETVSEYLSQYVDYLRGLDHVATVWREFAKNRLTSTISDVMMLTGPMYIKGFTEDLNVQGFVDRANTSLTVLDDGTITLIPVTALPKHKTYHPNEVSVRKVGSDNLVAEIIGDELSVVNIGPTDVVVLNLTGSSVEEAGFVYELRAKVTNVNQLFLKIGEENTGIKVKVEISSTGKTYRTIFEQVVKRSRIDVGFEPTNVDTIRVTLTMSNPNVVTLNAVRYEFRIYKLLLMSSTKKNTGVFQTVQIPITSDTAYLALTVDDETYGDAAIRYYIASSEDANGNPIGFVNINPKQKGQIINLGSSLAQARVTPEAVDPRWRITPEKKMGSKLYNILSTNVETESEEFAISANAISFTDVNAVIVPDTLKLYRGVNDYILQERLVELTKHVEAIACEVDINESTGWVKAVPLRLKVRELIDDQFIADAGSNYRNKIRVPWRIESPDDIVIERDDGKEVYAYIEAFEYQLSTAIPEVGDTFSYVEYRSTYSDQAVDSTHITFKGMGGEIVLDENYHYYVTFTTNLTEYILEEEVEVTLDLGSFVVRCTDDVLVPGVDYRIHANEYFIELLKTGGYNRHSELRIVEGELQGIATDISISYDFTEKQTRVTDYYETYVNVAIPTETVIIPFTAAEVAAGNFHLINEDDVSVLTTYRLHQGWNRIRTTQPYPSVNEYDTNQITGAASNAGIILPDTIIEMRPYIDSMRLVSQFTLTTLEPEEAAKCFAFIDNKIYVSFLPDFVEEDIINDSLTAGTKGTTLYCKKPLLDADYTNTGWTSQPEIFDLRFSYVDSTQEKFIYLKVEMESSRGTSTARINRIGMNKYKEISNG